MYFLSFEHSELERKIALIDCICAHALCVRMRYMHGCLASMWLVAVVAGLLFKCVAGRLWSLSAILLLCGKLTHYNWKHSGQNVHNYCTFIIMSLAHFFSVSHTHIIQVRTRLWALVYYVAAGGQLTIFFGFFLLTHNFSSKRFFVCLRFFFRGYANSIP